MLHTGTSRRTPAPKNGFFAKQQKCLGVEFRGRRMMQRNISTLIAANGLRWDICRNAKAGAAFCKSEKQACPQWHRGGGCSPDKITGSAPVKDDRKTERADPPTAACHCATCHTESQSKKADSRRIRPFFENWSDQIQQKSTFPLRSGPRYFLPPMPRTTSTPT